MNRTNNALMVAASVAGLLVLATVAVPQAPGGDALQQGFANPVE